MPGPMSSEPSLHLVERVEAHLDDRPWPWAEDHRGRIAAHWAKLTAANPALYNGRVLVGRERRFLPGLLQLRYVATDYAAFLTFRDLGFPDPGSGNFFGMAALRGADGAYLLGVMAAHTANAGRIYFPAGTPEPADVGANGSVDLLGNVLRELMEETGVGRHEIEIGEGWTVVVEGGRTALMREIRMDLPAEAIRARILAFLGRERRPELSDILVVSRPEEAVRAEIPGFVQAYLRRALGAG
jgi:8-oxo-dGTP pyrophosphatase MutT (NUDIX family)